MKTATPSTEEIISLPVGDVHPSPENDRLYQPIRLTDPAFKEMVKSVRAEGILSPIIVSSDQYIISGHRRYAAARRAGLRVVPCIVNRQVSREDDPEGFVRLLALHNQQRVKSIDEQVREAIVLTDSTAAYSDLLEHRRQKLDMSSFSGSTIKIGDRSKRSEISAARQPMLDAVQRIIEERREFWPLSDRQIHYALLNDPPLRHARKPDSRYANDLKSYKALTDLLTRARLTGIIPWKAIGDETRPVTLWQCWREPGPFLRGAVDEFARGYARDLMQSQPCHIEIVGEKLTVAGIIRPVASEYCIPMTIGRGFCSIDPRHQMASRYVASGRDRLVVLVLSDFDPDGESIAESFTRSMRDDFGIQNILPIKVAITGEHVQQYKLPQKMLAKETSSNHAKFLAAHGEYAYELEALPPAALQTILREAINSVIDTHAFNAEVDAEKQDAAKLEAVRKVMMRTMETVSFDG